MSAVVKRCACGREYTAETWKLLPLIGVDGAGEWRNCPCSPECTSTLLLHTCSEGPDGCCPGCGASMANPCPECGQAGYHAFDCADLEESHA